jgi:hypothetical protein
MQLRPGTRLRSQVCTTEVVVVRFPNRDVDVRCGGHPMISMDQQATAGLVLLPGFADGSQLGKRHAAEDGLELLVTKAGDGSLSDGQVPLPVKAAKPLPASD